MKFNTKRDKAFPFAGGLDLESAALSMKPGAMIACKNYECNVLGGYQRVAGFERLDGQPSPTKAADPTAARALIQPVPGSGSVLGVHIFEGDIYAFRNTVAGNQAKMYKATTSGWSEVNTPAFNPGGRFEIVNHNYYGNSDGNAMYGVDGKSLPFKFDGSTFEQITPPQDGIYPTHIVAHNYHHFLAYPGGSLIHSNIGDPSTYDAGMGGAGAIGTGADIVGLKVTVGGALAIFMRNRISLLYGNDATDWQKKDVRAQDDLAGAIPHTIQSMNDLFYLDDRGMTSLQHTEAYGNFQASIFSEQLSRYIASNKHRSIGSIISRSKNQYRLVIDANGSSEIITATFRNNKLAGLGISSFDPLISCTAASERSDGTEILLFGATDGYVYEMDVGTSFDGGGIESICKLAYHTYGRDSRRRTRFFYGNIGIEATSSLTLKIKPEFDYGSTDIASHPNRNNEVLGGGAAWNTKNWNEFLWSVQTYGEALFDIAGVGRNMSLIIYHKDAVTQPFTLNDATIHYATRGLKR